MIEPDDLQWKAFRYVAGEMPADEAAAFETQLGSQQSAREAVAGAVELAQAVDLAYLTAGCVVAPQESAAATKQLPSRTGWARPLVWMSAGAALCLAAVMVFVSYPGEAPKGAAAPQSAKAPAAAERDSRALANAWLDAENLRSELASLTAFAPDPFPAEAPQSDAEQGAAFDEGSVDEGALADGEEFTVPAWMLAAVSADELPDGGDAVQEN